MHLCLSELHGLRSDLRMSGPCRSRDEGRSCRTTTSWRCQKRRATSLAGPPVQRAVQVCELLQFFTYFNKPHSQRLWGTWPLLQHVVLTTGEDDIESIVGPFENFISSGTEVFLTSTAPDYRQGLWVMLQHMLDGAFEETAIKDIAKLMDVVLLNCGGRVDDWVAPYLRLALARLGTARSTNFATLLMNVLPSALVYSAPLALQALEAAGVTQRVRALTLTGQRASGDVPPPARVARVDALLMSQSGAACRHSSCGTRCCKSGTSSSGGRTTRS